MEDLITLDNTEQAHSGYTYFYNQMCIKQKERAISLINLINKGIKPFFYFIITY